MAAKQRLNSPFFSTWDFGYWQLNRRSLNGGSTVVCTKNRNNARKSNAQGPLP